MRSYDLWLLKEYESRKESSDKRYSLRSFSKELGVSATLISQLFSGKYELTHNLARKILLNLPHLNVHLILSRYQECDMKRKKVSELLNKHVMNQNILIEDINYNLIINKDISLIYKIIQCLNIEQFNKGNLITFISNRLTLNVETVTSSLDYLTDQGILIFNEGKTSLYPPVHVLEQGPDIEINLKRTANGIFDRYRPDYDESGAVASYDRQNIRGVDLITWDFIYLSEQSRVEYSQLVKTLLSDLRSLEADDIDTKSYIYNLGIHRFSF